MSEPAAVLSEFIERHFRHFNAASLLAAARGYCDHLQRGGQMMLSLGGAMSTAELGLSLAEMIRQNKVHAITCTGANLEEDVFNLVAHDFYESVPHYRYLSARDEQALLDRQMNRVTDTCVPEQQAMRYVENALRPKWIAADRSGQARFPHEFLYETLLDGSLAPQIDPSGSWLLAAAEKNLPLFVSGWEDSSLGNCYTARWIAGEVKHIHTVRSGVESAIALTRFGELLTDANPLGLFQIGGGIAGDFPIATLCRHRRTPIGYFCRISDSKPSYGATSATGPGQLAAGHEAIHLIESDATIVAPLLFAYVLRW